MAVVKTYFYDPVALYYIGLSTDSKPSDIPGGSRFLETDSGKTFFFNGTSWVEGSFRVRSMPYTYDIAEGNVPSHTGINWVGACVTSSTNEETVWDGNSIYTYIPTATKLKVSSSSTDDDSGGTGALTVYLTGLDNDYVPINETVTLDGQTGVETAETYLRIFTLKVITAGSGGKNAGDIYAGTGTIITGVPVNKYCKILAGHNNSLSGFWTVPAGNTLYITQMFLSESANKVTDFHLYQREFGQLFHLEYHFELTNNVIPITFDVPLVFPAKADVEPRVKSDTSGAHCVHSFGGWYET